MARRTSSSYPRSLVAARVDGILDDLGSHSSTRERRAADAIGGLGPEAFPYLVKALRSHPNAFARAVAARSLLKLGSGARRPLLRALRDPAMPVRLAALLALDQLWAPPLAAPIARLLRDPSPGIRHNTSRVLARHEVTASIPQLIRLLGDPVWHVRQQAALALGILGARRAHPALRRATSDPRPAVRKAARAALEQVEKSPPH